MHSHSDGGASSFWIGPEPPLEEQLQYHQAHHASQSYDMLSASISSISTDKTQPVVGHGQGHGRLSVPAPAAVPYLGTHTNTPEASHPPSLYTGISGNSPPSLPSTEGHSTGSQVPSHSHPGGGPRPQIDCSYIPTDLAHHAVPAGIPTHILSEDLQQPTQNPGNAISQSTAPPTPPDLNTDLELLRQVVSGVYARHPDREEHRSIEQCLHSLSGRASRNDPQPQPQPQPPSTSKKSFDPSKVYWDCEHCDFKNNYKSSFERHNRTWHFLEVQYYCPSQPCDYESLREDKVKTHWNNVHREDNKKSGENKPLKTTYPHPEKCPGCEKLIGSWRQMWACYTKHRCVDPKSLGASSETGGNDPGNDPGDDPGNDPGDDFGHDFGDDPGDDYGNDSDDEPDDDPGDESRQAGCNGVGSYMDDRGGERPSSHRYGPNVFGNAMGHTPWHSFPGAHAAETSHHPVASSARTQSMLDTVATTLNTMPPQPRQITLRPSTSPVSVRNTSRRTVGGRVSRSRRPSGPWPERPAHDSRRRLCRHCRIRRSDCQQCQNDPPSNEGCHRCRRSPNTATGQVDNPRMDGSFFQTSPTRQTIRYIDPAILNAQVYPDLTGSIPMGPSGNVDARGDMHYRHQEDYEPRTNFRPGNRSYHARAVTDVLVRGIPESEMETSVLDLKARSQIKNAQKADPVVVALPFRIPLPRLRRPLTGVATIPSGGMELVTRRAFGPPFLSPIKPSSGCQCSCRSRSQTTYFGRGRVDIAPGRKVEMNFKMMPAQRNAGHPLRTRIHVVVKMLRLRTSAAKSATGKREAHAALKDAVESTLEASETTTQEERKIVDLDDSADDSDIESIANSTFSSPACSRSSSYSDLTVFSSSRPSSPSQRDWEEETSCREDEPIQDVELYEEEENELEFRFDLDLEGSLKKLSEWAGVSTDTLCSERSTLDPDRVFEYLMKYLLWVLFSLARARDYEPNPCLRKKPSPRS